MLLTKEAMGGQDTVSKSDSEVSSVVEHLFRREGAKMVAILTRIFGVQHLALAEDVVQEALIRALQTWPFQGVPANPSAWIVRTARNLALDVVRRQQNFQEKEPEIIRLLEEDGATRTEGEEIADDTLRMMFVCAHPDIAPEAQIALALKNLCGFGVGEIASAFLTTEAAVAKRLTRARQQIRDEAIPFEIPEGEQLRLRLSSVLRALYLLFNEGYKASVGNQLVRNDICEEAIRLTTLLVGHSAGNQPSAHALLALMWLTAARNSARVDDQGQLMRLQDQDRAKWDEAKVARGLFHLAQSATGGELSEYHLQAGIAACHCTAPDFQSTDWAKILALYDQLAEMDDSAVIALNRAVAESNLHGPRAGLEAIARMRHRAALQNYYLLHAVLGDLEERLGNYAVAAKHFSRARELAGLEAEKAFLDRRAGSCREKAATH